MCPAFFINICNFSIIVWLLCHAILCELRVEEARLMFVVCVHKVTYMPVSINRYFVFRTLYVCNPTRGVANKHVSLYLSLSLSSLFHKGELSSENDDGVY